MKKQLIAILFLSLASSVFGITGGTVTTLSNGDKLHTFTATGVLTVEGKGVIVRALVVAGGGGGGKFVGGGGGAGEVREYFNYPLSQGEITITVGNGGTPGNSPGPGGKGGDSSIGTMIISKGGGGGGGVSGGDPTSGGSGGGGDCTPDNGAAAGWGINVNAGGNGKAANYSGGGGGGASGVGANGDNSKGGNGGNGYTSTITNDAGGIFAGGGGGGGYSSSPTTGGIGGTGGGGNGGASSSQPGVSAEANTGSGGGGGGATGGSGAVGGGGGSGVVYIRYTPTVDATSSIGFGKDYDWSSANWSTRTNVQDTNISNVSSNDGFVVLDFSATTTTENWDNLTGWLVYNNVTSEISPAGQLRQYSVGSEPRVLKTDLLPGNVFTFAHKFKADLLPYKAAINSGGCQVRLTDGTRDRYAILRDNFGYWKYTLFSGTYQDTTIPTIESDNYRFHIFSIYNNNVPTSDVIVLDGKELATGVKDNGATTSTECYYYVKLGDASSVQHHLDWTSIWNTITPWNTSDGILESNSTATAFDAGSGRRWAQLYFTHEADNGTAVSYQIKCASTTGGLAGAGYETITTSGGSITTKDRYAQVKITLSDASSGRYTPIVKSITLSSEASANPTLTGAFNMIGGKGFGRHR